MSAYYNEHDPFAAAWLRELIADGLIAPGEVDERSIEDVRPDELAGFVQCHFFAGIGIWSLALRQAGWPDEQPIWTGSCPCQPFSAAGKGGGFADERHLWPAFHWLIEQCGPELVLGEQVASKDGLAWLDLVSADVEASGYAFGAADTCAAGFGAPHIRQRLYWMADATGSRHIGAIAGAEGKARDEARMRVPCSERGYGSLASADDARLEGRIAERECAGERVARSGSLVRGLANTDGGNAGAERQQRSGEQRQQPQDGGAGGVGNASGSRTGRDTGAACSAQESLPGSRSADGRGGDALVASDADGGVEQSDSSRTGARSCDHREAGEEAARNMRPANGPALPLRASTVGGQRPGPLNGLWRDADWLGCTDGKWRPVAPGTFPLATAGTVRNRVGTLRGAGNAINVAQAQGFIEAVIEVRSGTILTSLEERSAA